jgi:CRISPR/Cas system endoribonuclease Cas6 (RAMP superfamily)
MANRILNPSSTHADRPIDGQVKATLTIKPHGLYMHVTPRKDRPAPQTTTSVPGRPVALKEVHDEKANREGGPVKGALPLHILYGD